MQRLLRMDSSNPPGPPQANGARPVIPLLSNRLADLAERAGEAFRSGNARSVEAAADYLKSGRILAEAKAECGHGAWLPFLERAGIPERTARRMMRLHRADMTPETLAEQGIKAALSRMARPSKSDTVTDLKPDTTPDEAPDSKARARLRRAERRANGLCVDCGRPSDGKARCLTCREVVAGRDRRRRALARTGEALAPRLAEAAKGRRGLRLSAEEVAELAGDGRGGRRR